MVTARLKSLAAAVPTAIDQASLWDDCFAERAAGARGGRRMWMSAGVATRHAVVDPRVEDVSGWGTGARMQRYVAEAMPLGKQAIDDALAAAGVDAGDIDLFVTVSCTGYATPGLDILLARDAGMGSSLQRMSIGHMGCYAAIPGLASVSDAVVARGLSALLLCVELPSLHVQPPSSDLGQLVVHALFGDAAVAAVVQPSGPGLEIVDVEARTDATHHADMTWDVTDLGFRMGLAPTVPSVLARHVRPLVESLLARHGLTIPDVAGWAIHPGGPRILDVCASHLGLDEKAMGPSRGTLSDFGNCSSGTVLLALDRLRRSEELDAGDHAVMLAFGPGLTLYAMLLRCDQRAEPRGS